MPFLIARICRRRVDVVNSITRKLSIKYGAVLLETRSLPDIYDRNKWHVDRMHPSRIGHQFIADSFGHLLRKRGFNVGEMRYSTKNNRSKRDSIIWMLKNGTPWFLKRSLDLLPAIAFLSIVELFHMARFGRNSEYASIHYPHFNQDSLNFPALLENERVS